MSLEPMIPLVAVACVGVFVLGCGVAAPRSLALVGFAGVTALAFRDGIENELLRIGLGVVSLALLAIYSHTIRRQTARGGFAGVAMVLFTAMAVALVLAALIAEQGPDVVVMRGAGALMVLVLAWRMYCDGSGGALLRSAALVVALSVILSLLLAVDTESWAGGRLRGPFGNANSLGIAAAIALLAAAAREIPFPKLIGVASVAVLTLSQSRSSAAGLLAGIVFIFLLGGVRATKNSQLAKRRVRVGAVLMLLIVFGAALMTVPDAIGASEGEGLVRGNDSRSEFWSAGLEIWRSSPLIGVGAGQLTIEIPSSPIRIAAEAGSVGFAIWAMLYITSWRAAWSSGDRFAAGVLTCLLVHQLFEGWLFASGSFIFSLFTMSLFAAVAVRPGGQARESKNALANPRTR